MSLFTQLARSRRSSNPYLVTGCIALIGVIGSFAIWRLLDSHERELRQSEFTSLALERAEAIQREFSDDVELLYSVNAFFMGSEKVSAEEFDVFTGWLIDRHKSILALEWAPEVTHAARQDFEARVSIADRYVTISEIGNDQHLKTATERDRYYPVEFLMQRQNRKSSVIGFDHASDPPRRKAMQCALQLRSPVASRRLDLFRVDGSDADRKGLLVAMPVLKHNSAEVRGYVVGLFQITSVVRRALQDFSGGGVDFALLDCTAPADNQVLYSQPAHDASLRALLAGQRGDTMRFPLAIANRQWEMVAAPSPEFFAARQTSNAFAALASMLLGTVALSISAFLLLERSARIERLVEERTSELQESNRLLRFSEEQEKLATETVRARAAELARANEVLAEKNAELDEFTYVASHDLQEPIRKLVSFSKLLEQDLGDNLTDQVQADLKYIVDAATRMRQLVQDLLSLSRAGRSAMRIEPIQVSDCVERAIEALEVCIQETNAEIICDELPVVNGDVTLLTQLFQNLIGNALKFVQNEPPMIHITAVQDGTHWILGVKDNGIGIKPEYCERIFKPFQRLHSRDEYSGTGIGLAICKKSVQRHKGEIFVESTIGEGSHFQIRLPAFGECEISAESDGLLAAHC